MKSRRDIDANVELKCGNPVPLLCSNPSARALLVFLILLSLNAVACYDWILSFLARLVRPIRAFAARIFAACVSRFHRVSGPQMSSNVISADFNTDDRLKILIVEDDRVTAHAYGQLLRNAGYQVSVAGTGREAITQMESSAPDAVLLDIMLPELDGIEVLRWIRARTPKLPVVVYTTAFSRILMTLALMGGATRVFDKSVAKPSELLHEFDLALGQHSKEHLAA
jgi:CheY-like chemotaxis protein